ncbi:MAG: hypothetical protein ACTSPI_12130, partial [Candidatus Heimdallarchaeaceae archaeon]
MVKFFKSLTFKIGLMIVIVEIVVLGILGVIYINRFSQSVDQRIQEKIQLPAELMNAGLLDFDAVEDEVTMKQLVGEELINGFFIGLDFNIYYSLNQTYKGQNIMDVDFIDISLFSINNPQHVVNFKKDTVTSVSIIYAADGLTPRFFVYIEISTHETTREKFNITLLFVIGYIGTVILTSFI